MASVIEDVRHGAEVYTSDGEKAGTVYAIVLAPGSNQVTHLAVDAGPHFPEPGFGDARIVTIEIAHLRSADSDRVDVDITKSDFAKLPPYEHRHFFQVPDAEPPQDGSLAARVWNAGIAIATSVASLGSGLAVPAEHFASAAFERSILNDAPVWRVEPEMYIGDVERVLVDDSNDTIVSLVVKRGEVFQHEVVLPMTNVTDISGGVIHTQLTDAEVKSLAKFEG
ncbi:MAG: PRC-barrel domain-containing protein [Chloroflexota bacterium]